MNAYVIAWYVSDGNDSVSIVCQSDNLPLDDAENLRNKWEPLIASGLEWDHVFTSIVSSTDIETIGDINDLSVGSSLVVED